MKKLFGELKITWKRLIIFAILIGIYTGIIAMVGIARDTSFADISISFEWWILFGTLIIINSESPKDSALKCFVFFLISQPLVYLVQVPFNQYGFGIFKYYVGWFKWTLLTIPMGYIGYYLKKDKWWGLFILGPILVFLGLHYQGFISETFTFFPNHLLSAIFCVVTMIIYPLYIFKDKVIKYIGLAISILIILFMTFYSLNNNKSYYNTTILTSGGSAGMVFDDKYKVSLKDESYGKVFIVYEEHLEDYMVNAEFKKTGETEFIIESPEGEKTIFDLVIYRHSYNITKKEQ